MEAPKQPQEVPVPQTKLQKLATMKQVVSNILASDASREKIPKISKLPMASSIHGKNIPKG